MARREGHCRVTGPLLSPEAESLFVSANVQLPSDLSVHDHAGGCKSLILRNCYGGVVLWVNKGGEMAGAF